MGSATESPTSANLNDNPSNDQQKLQFWSHKATTRAKAAADEVIAPAL